MAAVLAESTTVLRNAAKEPHIVDMVDFLNVMGADITGAGTDTIIIHGVKSLSGGSYSVMPDQIEAGTYMAAAAATGGAIMVKNDIPEQLRCISAELIKMNVDITEGEDYILVSRMGKLRASDVNTYPYPGFPTDMQPQLAAVMCLAEGRSAITETIWKNRFQYVSELESFGAKMSLMENKLTIEGSGHLKVGNVSACDIRAGAAMVIAALCADGTSEISDISHIERGYCNFTEKLSKLGADIYLENGV